MTIERYLAELRRRLPSTRRERFLREAEIHLREAARESVRMGCEPSEAEARAVEAFGPADVVAERVRRETAPIAVRRASGLALLALTGLFLPLYVVPENLLPPAPWAERPSYLGALLGVALACWIGALGAAAVSVVMPPRWGARALAGSAVLALASGLSALAASLAWHVEAPATPWSIVLIETPMVAVELAALLGVATWARERAATAG